MTSDQDRPTRGRRHLVRSLLWWLLIIVLGVTASWWMPRLSPAPPVDRDAAPAMELVAAEDDCTTLGREDPEQQPDGESPAPNPEPSTPESDEFCPELPIPLGPADLLPFITAWIAGGLADALDSVAQSIGHETLILRPEALSIMDPADSSGFYLLSFGVARAAMLLLITIGGLWIMTRHDVQSQYTVKELAPRFVFAAIGMELSIRILGWVIVHANTVIDAILATGFAGVSVEKIAETLQQVATDVRSDQSWMAIMLILGLLTMLTLLLLGMVSRTLILMLLAISGPFALACHALPFTEPIAKIWWKALGACVASGIGQALVLVLWFRAFFNGEDRNVNPFNMPEAISQYADMLLVMALLWLMHKAVSIPMRKAFAPFGGSPLSQVLRIAGSVAAAKTFGLIGRTGPRTRIPHPARPAANPGADSTRRQQGHAPTADPTNRDVPRATPPVAPPKHHDHSPTDGPGDTRPRVRQDSFPAPARRARPSDALPSRRPFLPRITTPCPTPPVVGGDPQPGTSRSRRDDPMPRRRPTRTFSPRRPERRPGQW